MTLCTVSPCVAANAGPHARPSSVHMSSTSHVRFSSHRVARRVSTLAVPVDVISQIAEGTDMALAVGGIAGVTALSAALIASDPEKRRVEQMKETGGDELEAVKKYFNTSGFERWNKIYGETDEVNKVQLDIRQGHAQTVDKVLRWVDEEGGV